MLNVAQSKQHFLEKQEVRELLSDEIPGRVTVRPDPSPTLCSVLNQSVFCSRSLLW